jgi:ASC-1-like (ASCH) protein
MIKNKFITSFWINYIENGEKKVEGRLGSTDINDGDIINWISGQKEITTRIVSKKLYPSFEEMLISEGLKNVLPSIKSIKEGLDVYYTFYTKEEEKINGVAALKFELIKF